MRKSAICIFRSWDDCTHPSQPSLMIGASDVRHYAAVADDAYRFMPILLLPDDLARFHGTNERIAIADYARVVDFFEHFIRQND